MYTFIEVLACCLLISTLTYQVTFTGAVVNETIGDLTFECPDRWIAASGGCYLAVETAMTWNDARRSCMNANGSDLVQVNDVEYAEIVRPSAPTSHPDNLFWIGLNRFFEKDEGEAAWGEMGDYPLWKGLWNNDEPNFEVGDCVAGSNNSFWAVKACDMKLPFMCQYPACLNGYFRCENGHGCLNPKWRCDLENDCGDNSDEKNCPSRCQFVVITGEKSTDGFTVSSINNNRECVWTIEAPVGKRIRVNLSAVNIEEMADFLQVWTGSSSLSFMNSTLLANMTGILQPSIFFSSNNFIFIRLVTDDSNLRTSGFSISWTTNIAELETPRILTATTTWQEVTSPFYGLFPSVLNLDLEWAVISDNDVISIEFLEMDIPGSLTVKDGEAVALSDLTSVPNPNIYISSNRTIKIRMMTDMSYGKGFRLRYMKGCTLVVSAYQGIIQSPGFTQDAYSRQYPNNVSCQWILNATAVGRGMTLRFTSFLLSNTDIVQVFINSSETAVHGGTGFTGKQLPDLVKSNEGIIKLKFITDQALTDSGFSANFSIDCPMVKANVSEFTVWNVTAYSFETKVAVSCIYGYSFRQEEYRSKSQVIMTCLYGGQWDLKRIPDCQITYCGAPPAIVNGYIANATGVTVNKTARYECNSNFMRQGEDFSVCSYSGEWINIPRCVSPSCPSIGNLSFGFIASEAGNISNGQYGSVARFACNTGYELKGIQYSYCNGTAWSHKKMPQCIKLKCPSPVISNSITVLPTEAAFEDILNVTCASGYQLSHNRTVRCLSNQTFNDLPQCIDVDECKSLNCTYAQFCVNTMGSYRCDCKPGYLKPPNGTGSCTDINECSIKNGSCNQICNNFNGSYQCQCWPGFDLYIGNGSNEIPLASSETGLREGDTYYINHTCVRKLCKKPQVPANASILTVRDNFYFGDEILYMCNVGFSFSGGTRNLTRQCNSSGLWTGDDPVCTIMKCPVFPSVRWGRFKSSGSISFGDQVNLECQYTNTTWINKTIICGYKNGTLQLLGDNMTCPVIDCGPPTNVLPNGANKSLVMNSTLFLDYPSFTFSCMPGYEAQGQSETGGMLVRCKENGKWNLGNLTCTGKTCTDPGTPGGTVQNATSYEIGQKVFYTCSRTGFQPDLPGPIECIYNSTSGNVSWNTNSRPVCKDITPPIFKDCNEDIYVDAMDQVTFGKSFNVSDNSGGIKQITYNKIIWEGDVVSLSTVLVTTATDFSDNKATCVKNINIIDRSIKPVLNCPSYKVLDVMNASSTTYNVQDFVNVSAGFIKSIIPSTVTINYTTYLLNTIAEVTVVAANNFSTESNCTFLVSTKLAGCFSEAIPDDLYGKKTGFAQSSGGVNVTLTCPDGYGYQDGRVTRIAVCSQGGSWSPVLPLQTCIKYTNPYFVISITVVFRSDILTKDCKEDHDNQLRKSNITLANEFSRICTMQWTITDFVTATDALQITTVFSVNLNNLTVNMDARIECVSKLRTALSSNLSTSIFDYGDLPCSNSAHLLNVLAVTVNDLPGLSCDFDKTLNNTERGFQCLPCAPGSYYGQNRCMSCPDGTYQDTYGQTACKNCSDGFTPAPQKTFCQKLCPAGFRSVDGLPPCSPCPLDNYWNDSRSCLGCPSGYSTVGIVGAKDQQQCKAPCVPGTYSITGYMPCKPCPMNFYQNQTRGITCISCPSDSTTSFIGSNSSSNCQNQTCNATVQCNGRGTCMYNENKPVCNCFPGYYGNRCETPVHICDSQPCLNGGVCNHSAAYNVVQCTCPQANKCSMGSAQNKTYGGEGYSKYEVQSSQAACEKVCVDYAACVALSYREGYCFIYTSLASVQQNPNNNSILLYKVCELLFVGNRCEIDNINECTFSSCSQYGMCQNLVNDSKCLCPIYGNFQLPRCERTSNFCNPNPCQNGGTCRQFDFVNYECTCRPGFTGQKCETNIDNCKENPDGCLYGGTCNDLDNQYNCTCLNGFSGDHCSLRPNYCPGQCPHANLCYNDFNNFIARCICSYPYETKYLNVCKISTATDNQRIPEKYGYVLIGGGATVTGCEQACVSRQNCKAFTFYHDAQACIGYNDFYPLESRNNATYYLIGCSDVDSGQCQFIDSCRNVTCANNGTCRNGTCMCKAGFTGFTCQHSIDDCLGNPCQNGGTCIDGYLNYTCLCAKGYNETNCTRNINDCVGKCTNNGSSSCMDLVDDYNCICNPGYSGKNCELNINDCASYPCQHGGICTDLVNSYTCNCSDTVGWGEKDCSQLTDYCSSKPCKNNAPCYSVEDIFFCSCPGNTKGVTCETGLPVCNVVSSPCTKSGACQENEGSARCSCQQDYSGKACELVKDWCKLDNGTSICENGGECMLLEPLGYKCQCITGYSGVNCTIPARPCDSNPCANGSICRSTVTDYICQCPKGKPYVEKRCKDVSTNYDIVFDERLAEGTMLEMAHRLEGSQLSVMMWFRFNTFAGKVSANAKLLYITGNTNAIRYQQSSNDGFHVIVTVDGVTVGNGSTSTIFMMPEYTPRSYLMNGNWHHFALTMNGTSATVIVDGIQTNSVANYSLGLNLNTQVFIGLDYTGVISQVTVWTSTLSYSDILRYFSNVSYAPNGIMAQGWWSYVFHPGVSRQFPSQVKCDSCNRLQVDKTPPEGVCIRDPYALKISTINDRFVTLGTLEQQNLKSKANFTGNNVTSTLPQDATYPLGQYDAIFVAKDESGNYQDCRFPIYVKYYGNCPLLKTDASLIRYMYNGMQVDSISTVNCTNTSYQPSAALPRYIPCGVLGVYSAKNPYVDKVLPSCGYKVMNKYRIDVQMQYQLQLQCSDLFLKSLFSSIINKFNDTTANGTIRQFCESSACSNVIVTGKCADVNAFIAVQIFLNRSFISSGQVNYTLTEATRIIVLVERKFIFPNVANSKWLEETVVISERKICNTGSSFINGACVECGKGMFSNNQSGLCDFCAIGTYQPSSGKESCLPCTSSRTTRAIGSMAETDCISVCPKGQYYKYNATTQVSSCQKCPRHFYQDEDGQSFCKPCPFKKVTAEEGSNSSTQCQDDCLSGEEPATGSDAPCRKCVQGTYRNRGKDDSCRPCPSGNTTDRIGSISIEECNIRRCVAGEFVSNNNTCEPCPLDTYQSKDMPFSYTNCISCNVSNYGTRNVSSTNFTDCKNFCQAGYENISGNCTPCKRGFYKDHSVLEARWGSCVACTDRNRTTDREGSVSSDNCNIRRCVAGEYISGGQCIPCPLDTYQPMDMPYSNTNCTQCSITLGSTYGTMSVRSSNTTDCKFFCQPGYESTNGSCTPCKRGFFKDHSMPEARWRSCIPCIDQTRTTDKEGSTSNINCTIRRCVAGEYLSGDQCTPCPLDTFQPMDMPYSNTNCTPCNSTYGTRNVNSTSMTDCRVFCQPGYESNNGSCTPCKRGFFKDHSMPEARWGPCVPCTNKTKTTNSEGSTSNNNCVISRCVAGEYISGDQCTPCPLDTFQPMDMPYSNTNCTPCNISLGSNYGTRNVNSTSTSDCKVFCQSGKENINGSCMPCKRGFYKDHSMPEARWGSCVPCSDQTRTTDKEGSTSNIDCIIRRCNAGEYISGNQCTPCPLDTFQPMDMPYSNTNCIPCNSTLGPNYGTMTERSINTTDCKPFCLGGQQFDIATQKCVPCPMGYYKPSELRFNGCLKCRENYTTSREGQISNTSCNVRDCPKGTYIRGEDCIPCAYASYQDLPYQNSCIPCGLNLNTSTTGAVSRNDCTIWCGPGQEGSINCTVCAEDKFKPSAGYGQCMPCDPNKDYTANMYRTACDVLYCRMGYFNISETCIKCAAGKYKSGRGNMACLDCPAGNTSMEGSIDCPLLHCVPGKTLSVDNKTCIECPKGSWKNQTGNMTCTPCDYNLTTEGTGANSSDTCDTEVCGLGQYRNPSKKIGCEKCPVGTYQNEKGQTTCKNCTNGNTTLDVGSDDITDCVTICAAGRQYNNMTRTCDPCPRGTYKTVVGNAQSGQIIPCDQCPSGNTTLSAGSTRSDDCKLVICQPGSYRPEGSLICRPCPIGQYQFSSDQTMCLSCANNYTTSELGSTSNSSCIRDCRTSGGQYYKNGTCAPCHIGQYREPDPYLNKIYDGCILCGSGTSTLGTGSKSQSECIPDAPKDRQEPVIMSVSFSFNMTFTSNTQCSVDNREKIRIQIESVIYAQFRTKGQSLCKNNCKNIVVTISSSSCGGTRRKRQADTNLIVVEIQVQNVSAIFNETSGNQTVQRTAESVLSQTLQNPATYTVTNGTLTFKLEKISVPNIIINCDAGQQVNKTLNSCEFCPTGTKGEVAGICVPCEINTYQNLTGQTKCIPCEESKPYTERNGSTSVSQCKSSCQQGSYWNETSSSCILCPFGQYQPEKNQTKCLLCAVNYTTSALGSASETSCIRDCRTKGGEYIKNGTCVPCPIGQYREPDPTFKMQDGCILCASGTSTTQQGSISRTHCLNVDPKDRMEPSIMSVSFSFTMTFTSHTKCVTGNKGIIRNQIESVIYAQFRKKGQGLCNNNCTNILVSISSPCTSSKKRQADYAVIVPVGIQNVSTVLNGTDGNQRTAESVLLETIQDPAAYTVKNGTLDLSLKNTTVPTQTINCNEGQQLNQTLDSCEFCPAGTKGEFAGSCGLCEINKYQNLTGQTKCIPCEESKPFTERNGSTSVSQCKSLCEVQPNYCNFKGVCISSGQSATCDCRSDYTGSRCEFRAEPKSNQDAILGGSIGGGVGVLTLILFTVGCFVCLKRGVKKDSNDKRSVVSRGDYKEMEFFRNPVYDSGNSSIGPYATRPYPGYAYPSIEYDNFHQQSGMDSSGYQERPDLQYEEDNDQFVWKSAA